MRWFFWRKATDKYSGFPVEVQTALRHYDAQKPWLGRILGRDDARIRAMRRLSLEQRSSLESLLACFCKNPPRDTDSSKFVLCAIAKKISPSRIEQAEFCSITTALAQLKKRRLNLPENVLSLLKTNNPFFTAVKIKDFDRIGLLTSAYLPAILSNNGIGLFGVCETLLKAGLLLSPELANRLVEHGDGFIADCLKAAEASGLALTDELVEFFLQIKNAPCFYKSVSILAEHNQFTEEIKAAILKASIQGRYIYRFDEVLSLLATATLLNQEILLICLKELANPQSPVIFVLSNIVNSLAKNEILKRDILLLVFKHQEPLEFANFLGAFYKAGLPITSSTMKTLLRYRRGRFSILPVTKFPCIDALSSLHTSGYFKEEMLADLIQTEHPKELSAIIIQLNNHHIYKESYVSQLRAKNHSHISQLIDRLVSNRKFNSGNFRALMECNEERLNNLKEIHNSLSANDITGAKERLRNLCRAMGALSLREFHLLNDLFADIFPEIIFEPEHLQETRNVVFFKQFSYFMMTEAGCCSLRTMLSKNLHLINRVTEALLLENCEYALTPARITVLDKISLSSSGIACLVLLLKANHALLRSETFVKTLFEKQVIGEVTTENRAEFRKFVTESVETQSWLKMLWMENDEENNKLTIAKRMQKDPLGSKCLLWMRDLAKSKPGEYNTLAPYVRRV